MTATQFFSLFQLLFAGQVTPGPNNVLLSSSGMRFGFKATLRHVWGVILGHAFMEFVVAFGLGKIYSAFPVIETVLTFVAIVILIYLSYKIATAPVGDFADVESTARPWGFWQAAAFQWINPKAWLIAIGVSASYASGTETFRNALIIGSTAILVGVISSHTWAAFGVAMRRILNTPLKRRVFNLTMCGLMIWSVVLILGDH